MDSRIFVTSDFHLFHENIMKYCNRYTKTRKSINDYTNDLLYYLKSFIKPNDILLFLGDVACGPGKSVELIKKYFDLLECEKYFIRGNHDYWLTNEDILKIGFKKVFDYILIEDTLFCHYPLDIPYGVLIRYDDHQYLWGLFYENQNIKKIIHGHVHNGKVRESSDGIKRINVSVDAKKRGFNIIEYNDEKLLEFLKS